MDIYIINELHIGRYLNAKNTQHNIRISGYEMEGGESLVNCHRNGSGLNLHLGKQNTDCSGDVLLENAVPV